MDEISKLQTILKMLPKASKACIELKHCSSKEIYASDNCTCETYNLPCTDLRCCQRNMKTRFWCVQHFFRDQQGRVGWLTGNFNKVHELCGPDIANSKLKAFHRHIYAAAKTMGKLDFNVYPALIQRFVLLFSNSYSISGGKLHKKLRFSLWITLPVSLNTALCRIISFYINFHDWDLFAGFWFLIKNNVVQFWQNMVCYKSRFCSLILYLHKYLAIYLNIW